jgi:hypothetical protein
MGPNVDNRLYFYRLNQREVPSVTGDVIPENVSSLAQYRKEVIGQYSRDLAKAGIEKTLLSKEWVNSRGVIFRFDRSALEVRVMDEQECVKSDVALSCYVRAALRGLISSKDAPLPHNLLVSDFNSTLTSGLDAKVLNPHGPKARQVCQYLFDLAWANADKEEKKYLPIVQKRIERGSLSELIRGRISKRAQKTDIKEAILGVYSTLIKCLADNQPYF